MNTNTTTTVLHCEMSHSCESPVTMLDNKGFIYCTRHGLDRRDGYHYCRRLRAYEVNRLRKGLTVLHY